MKNDSASNGAKAPLGGDTYIHEALSPLCRSVVYQHRVVAVRINPYFHGAYGVIAGIGFDGRAKYGVGSEAVRSHPKDVAGKVTPRLFLD